MRSFLARWCSIICWLSIPLLFYAFESASCEAIQIDRASRQRLYGRVVETHDQLRLETAVHRYVADDFEAPKISLVGNIHLGSESYFHSINQYLESADLVLFEAPGRPGFLRVVKMDPKSKRLRMDSAAKFITWHLVNYQRQNGEYPQELDLLMKSVTRLAPRSFLKRALVDDAWGRPWYYYKSDTGFVLTSLGADGEIGGEDQDADLSIDGTSTQVQQKQQSQSLFQQQEIETIARRLDWIYQTDGIDYSSPKFILSDIDASEIAGFAIANQAAAPPPNVFEDEKPSDDPTLAKSQREKYRAKLIRMLNPKNDPSFQPQRLRGQMRQRYEKMILSRNDIVIEDIARFISRQPDLKHICVLYGGGHMPDLNHRLLVEFGYRHDRVQWLVAMSADLKATENGRRDH